MWRVSRAADRTFLIQLANLTGSGQAAFSFSSSSHPARELQTFETSRVLLEDGRELAHVAVLGLDERRGGDSLHVDAEDEAPALAVGVLAVDAVRARAWVALLERDLLPQLPPCGASVARSISGSGRSMGQVSRCFNRTVNRPGRTAVTETAMMR